MAIAAIWWWTARRSRQAPGNAELREPTLSPLSLTSALGETASAAERRAELRAATESSRGGSADTRPASEARSAAADGRAVNEVRGAAADIRATNEARGERAGAERAGAERAGGAWSDRAGTGTDRGGAEPREWGIPPLQPLSIRAADFDDIPSLEEPMLTSADPIDFSLDSSRATGAPRFPSHAPAASTRREPVLREHPEEEAEDSEQAAAYPEGAAYPEEEVQPEERMASPTPAVQGVHTPRAGYAVQAGADAGAHAGSDPVASDVHAASVSRPMPAAPSGPPEQLAAPPAASSARWRPASENSDRYSTAAPQAPNVSEKQKIVALRVCSVGDARWTGAGLISALETHGLAYGRYQVFHRRHSDGRSIFCVASLVEPGTFDIASMPDGLFRGISLFAVLPGPIEPVQTIEAMLETARDLARDLSGTLQDAKGMPFSPQRAEALLKDVSRFQALLV